MSETLPQKQALAANPWLEALYREPAQALIRRFGIEHWTERYLGELARATAFSEIADLSAACFAASCLPISMRAYEFEFDLAKLVTPIAAQIDCATAIEICTGERERWRVTTADGRTLEAECLVVAVPLDRAAKLIPIDEPTNLPASVQVFHVRGELRPEFREGEMIFFPAGSDDFVLVREPNGTCLLYTKRIVPDLDRFFVDATALAWRSWDPAFFLGPRMLDCERGEGLYLVGDHSVCSLEDAFITGLFAADRIARYDARIASRSGRSGLEPTFDHGHPSPSMR